MERLRRTIHLDFHTMPGIYDFGENFDAKEFAQILSDAHVQLVNAFAVCGMGYSYYDTKLGIKYPGLKGNMLADIVRECHKKGIGVAAYLNWTWGPAIARKHPEWCRIDENGNMVNMEIKRKQGNDTMSFCYNNGYREYLKEVVKEVVALGVDGIYFDSIYPRPCYCNKCLEDMTEQGVDIDSVAAVTQFTYKNILKLLDEISEIVPKDMNVIYSAVSAEDKIGKQRRTEIEHLPSSWGYEDVPYYAAFSRPLYGRDNVIYMTGRFQKCWGDFGGFKGRASLENDMYDALYTDMGFCVGDHMHPARNLNREMYKVIGEVFEKFMQYDKWVDDTNLVTEVAVIKNKFDPYTNELALRGVMTKLAYTGTARVLGELKQSFDFIIEDMDFDKYKVIILPDVIKMTDKLKAKLEKFIAGGGKVISTGESGLNADKSAFALDAWNFVKFDGIDPKETSFFKADERMNEMPFEWSTYREGVYMTATDKKYEIVPHVNPYFDENNNFEHLMGFCKYNPPEKESGHATMAMSDSVCQISFKVFSAYGKHFMPVHKGLVKYALEKFLPDPVIKAPDMPSTARLSLADGKDYSILHVKVTFPEHRGTMGMVEEHGELNAGHTVSVKGTYKSASVVPDGTPVEIKAENGYTTITLPDITGYAMIKLDK